MTQVATVERLLDHSRAEVSIRRKSACGSDCAKCGGCGAESVTMTAQAKNLIGAQPGEQVLVESNTAEIMYIAVLVYLLPIAALVFGGILATLVTDRTAVQILITVLCMAAALIPAKRYDRKTRQSKETPLVITRVLSSCKGCK